MPDVIYRFGAFELIPHAQRLLREGVPVPITAKALTTLAVLVENAGRTVEKEELLGAVWPDAIVEEANLTQQIFILRKLLAEAPRDYRFIATVPRRGYRFVAPVTVVAPSARPAPGAGAPLRLHLKLDPSSPLHLESSRPFAISPDGRRLAYVGRDDGGTALYVRSLNDTTARRVPGSDGASTPGFSPDGRWVAFFARGKLFKALVAGGTPIAICEVGDECRGACWTADEEIVFAPTPASGLRVVSANGGEMVEASRLDFAAGERSHRWPSVLPGRRDVLFTIARAGSSSFDEADIGLLSLDTGRRCVVQRFGSAAQYVASGHLVYVRGGALMAAPFDPRRQAGTGPPVPVLTGLLALPTGAGQFDCSEPGLLVYLTGDGRDIGQRLEVLTPGGGLDPLPMRAPRFEEPRFSPDERQIAVGVRAGTSDIWVHDNLRGSARRLTFEADNFAAIWAPDGRSLVFSSNRQGPCSLYRTDLDQAEAQLLLAREFDLVPGSWCPDGRVLAFTEYHPVTGADVYLWTAGYDSEPTALRRTRANEYCPTFSPDGRRIAFVSDESGRSQVYVVSLPVERPPIPITIEGGSEPVWQRDGRRLYYRTGSAICAVPIDGDDPGAATPEVVADGPFQAGSLTGIANYDVAGDGRLLVVSQSAARARPVELSVVVDWFADLRQVIG